MARSGTKPMTAILLGHLADPIQGAKAESARDVFIESLAQAKQKEEKTQTHYQLAHLDAKTGETLHLNITNDLLQDALTPALTLENTMNIVSEYNLIIACANTITELNILLKILKPCLPEKDSHRVVIVAGAPLYNTQRDNAFDYDGHPIVSLQSNNLHANLCLFTKLYKPAKPKPFSIWDQSPAADAKQGPGPVGKRRKKKTRPNESQAPTASSTAPKIDFSKIRGIK